MYGGAQTAPRERSRTMDIAALSEKMVDLFFCILAGYIAAKAGVMDAQTNKKLSSLIVNLTNPLQILASALAGERLLSNREVLGLTGVIAAIYAALIALSFAVPALLRAPKQHRGVYQFMFIFANTGFLGYPIVESLLGYSATFYVTLYVLFFQILCWSYGVSLISGERRFRLHWSILRHPCVVAALASFVIYLTGWHAPALVYGAARYVGNITSPAAMLIVGCSLAQMRPGQIFGNWRIYALTLLKLVAVPLAAYFVLRGVLRDEFVLCVLTVLLCMPIATNTTLISCQYGADESVASAGVFVSTLVCVLTIPLMMRLLFG